LLMYEWSFQGQNEYNGVGETSMSDCIVYNGQGNAADQVMSHQPIGEMTHGVW